MHRVALHATTMGATPMVNFIKLFTSFHGRISRKSWWLGSLTIFALSIGGILVLDPNVFSLDSDVVAPPNWAATIWNLLLVFPTTVIAVKRFNDRDWPNWLGYGWGLVVTIDVIAPQFGYLTGPTISVTDAIGLSIYLSALLFVFIVNGFLRGTPGPNRYGPDPLQGT